MPPKKKEAEAPLDLPMTSPADVWDVDTSEPRSSFIKRVAVDIMRIAASERGYAKDDISKNAFARAVELADLLGLKD